MAIILVNKNGRIQELQVGDTVSAVTRGPWGDHAIITGGSPSGGTYSNIIDHISISAGGNAVNFGSILTSLIMYHSACSNGTIAIIGGGIYGSALNLINKFTIATQSVNATNFGGYTLTSARHYLASVSNCIRAVFIGGSNTSTTVDYVLFATQAGAVTFPSLYTSPSTYPCASSNNTIGLIGGTTTIQYITIAVDNASQAFSNLLTSARDEGTSVANNTRALFAGPSSGVSDTIEYVNFDNKITSIDFGNLTVGRADFNGSTSNGIRGTFNGGWTGAYRNEIDYVVIMTTMNAVDFGDLSLGRYGSASTSGT